MLRTYRVIQADVLEAEIDGTFDALFCDPPYGLKFMGRAWDHGVPSALVWAHLAKYLRPGANVAAFGGTRTYHRLASAIEDSGLEIRDSIWNWAYGTGWPKPANVSKSLDKHLGAERRVVGENPNARPNRAGVPGNATGTQTAGAPLTVAGSEPGQRFEGYHANVKPAVEPICLARVPLEGTLARNALAHGVAGLNVDACRISTGTTSAGRWPSNMILTCACDVSDAHAPECPVAVLDAQSDGASRFFYVAKASKRERSGCKHPCMKPVVLCEYIARLLLPPPRADGAPRRLLAPFSGSGSEMIGALLAGWDQVVGIEMSEEWARESERRIREWAW